MEKSIDWDQLIKSLRSLRTNTLEPGRAWWLRSPYVGNRARSLYERREILRALLSVWPFPALWSSGDTKTTFRWSFPTPDQLDEIVESMYEGEWMLAFFKDKTCSPLRNIAKVPTQQDALEELAADLGARAVIMSPVDDNEWLLLINE